MNDTEKFLNPISDALPCGADLESDAAADDTSLFGLQSQLYELDAMASELRRSGSEESDWKKLLAASEDFLTQNRHLRIFIYYIKSSLVVNGLEGFASSVQVLRKNIELFWEHLHPSPTVEGGKQARINTLSSLVGNAVNYELKNLLLPGTNGVSVEQYQGNRQDAAASSGFGKQVLANTEIESLEAIRAMISTLLEDVQAIYNKVDEEYSSDDEVSCGEFLADFDANLMPELRFLSYVYREQTPVDKESTLPGQAVAHIPTSHSDGLTHDQIREMLDQIIKTFEKKEPSSPVPLILRRAKRLIGMSFLDLVDDAVGDSAVQKAKELLGKQDE